MHKFQKILSAVQNYFRLLEAAGLFFILLAGALELFAIRDGDRERQFFDQKVYGQILLDEVTYRAYWLKEQLLILQEPKKIRLQDVFGKRPDVIDRLEELTNFSLDIYQMVWTRSEGLLSMVEDFRTSVNLPPSIEISKAKTTLSSLRSATDSMRTEMRLEDGTFKFPVGHLMKCELLVTKAREDAIQAVGTTTAELEKRRA